VPTGGFRPGAGQPNRYDEDETMTEIILQEDIENLGSAGDVVDVKPGYARNFLIPRGLARRATEGNLKRIEEERRRREHAASRELQEAEGLASELEGLSLSFSVRAGEEGKLFGSVTAQDIADRLAEQGFEVDRRTLQLEEPIKELGVYRVSVDLHSEVQPEIKIWVVAEE